MTSSIERARKARDQVIADHQLLRHTAAVVLSAARDALGAPERLDAVRAALRDLRAELERHLDYEERVLAGLLFDASADGRHRVDQMSEDHAGQRAVLVALTEDASSGARPIEDIVDELGWFARSLMHDMDREERSLLNDDVLGIGPVVVSPPNG